MEGPRPTIRQLGFKDLVRIFYGLTAGDIEIYRIVLVRPGSTIKDLGRILERDRRGLVRRVKRLRAAGWIGDYDRHLGHENRILIARDFGLIRTEMIEVAETLARGVR